MTRLDVNHCLDKLGETDHAIVLHKSYGLTAREIKELLGLGSEASVDTRYCQACKLLRQCLESYRHVQCGEHSHRKVTDAAL
jgi:hypothetical protein